ncbi:hypothetical protein Q5752_004959 [Cryptotrichosporon argae]
MPTVYLIPPEEGGERITLYPRASPSPQRTSFPPLDFTHAAFPPPGPPGLAGSGLPLLPGTAMPAGSRHSLPNAWTGMAGQFGAPPPRFSRRGSRGRGGVPPGVVMPKSRAEVQADRRWSVASSHAGVLDELAGPSRLPPSPTEEQVEHLQDERPQESLSERAARPVSFQATRSASLPSAVRGLGGSDDAVLRIPSPLEQPRRSVSLPLSSNDSVDATLAAIVSVAVTTADETSAAAMAHVQGASLPQPEVPLTAFPSSRPVAPPPSGSDAIDALASPAPAHAETPLPAPKKRRRALSLSSVLRRRTGPAPPVPALPTAAAPTPLVPEPKLRKQRSLKELFGLREKERGRTSNAPPLPPLPPFPAAPAPAPKSCDERRPRLRRARSKLALTLSVSASDTDAAPAPALTSAPAAPPARTITKRFSLTSLSFKRRGSCSTDSTAATPTSSAPDTPADFGPDARVPDVPKIPDVYRVEKERQVVPSREPLSPGRAALEAADRVCGNSDNSGDLGHDAWRETAIESDHNGVVPAPATHGVEDALARTLPRISDATLKLDHAQPAEALSPVAELADAAAASPSKPALLPAADFFDAPAPPSPPLRPFSFVPSLASSPAHSAASSISSLASLTPTTATASPAVRARLMLVSPRTRRDPAGRLRDDGVLADVARGVARARAGQTYHARAASETGMLGSPGKSTAPWTDGAQVDEPAQLPGVASLDAFNAAVAADSDKPAPEPAIPARPSGSASSDSLSHASESSDEPLRTPRPDSDGDGDDAVGIAVGVAEDEHDRGIPSFPTFATLVLGPAFDAVAHALPACGTGSAPPTPGGGSGPKRLSAPDYRRLLTRDKALPTLPSVASVSRSLDLGRDARPDASDMPPHGARGARHTAHMRRASLGPAVTGALAAGVQLGSLRFDALGLDFAAAVVAA